MSLVRLSEHTMFSEEVYESILAPNFGDIIKHIKEHQIGLMAENPITLWQNIQYLGNGQTLTAKV